MSVSTGNGGSSLCEPHKRGRDLPLPSIPRTYTQNTGIVEIGRDRSSPATVAASCMHRSRRDETDRCEQNREHALPMRHIST